MPKTEQLALRFQRTSDSYSIAELALLSTTDIYECADEELLVRLKEDRRLERKPCGIHAGELGEYFSMWANTPTGGLMVIGQENDGTFSGCSRLDQNAINDLEGAGHFHCPNARSDSKRIAVTLPSGQKDYVVLIYVHYNEQKVVYDIKNSAYYRIGESKIKLTTEQITELGIEKGQIDLEQTPVSAISYPDDFNMQLIKQYVHGVVTMKNLAASHSDEEILVHGRLGKIKTDQFIPNVACTLLFAKDPLLFFPGCRVRFLRFDGETEKTGKDYNVVKQFWIEGPIPEVIVKSADTVRSQLREFSHLDTDGRFYTTAEYPESAWYEALVNACVHRSYGLKNMNVFVKMFDDRLIIESPGGFPPNVTPETIYDTHSPRNPHLMTALFYMAFVKCHNEGTRRMRDSMDASSLPAPEFAQKAVASGYNSVRVTLRNNLKLRKLWIDTEASRVLGNARVKELGKVELRILNYIAEHGSINVTQAQKLLGAQGTSANWHSVKRKFLEGMVAKGLLIREHSKVVQRDSRSRYLLAPLVSKSTNGGEGPGKGET